MNKQELIEKIKKLPFVLLSERYISQNYVLELLEQLDEPEKVKVPQFVADWYEKHKDDLEYDIWEYILHWGKQQKSEFYEWMNHANNKPFQTLSNMHQFGYEVEKEKRYTVTVKGNIKDNLLVYGKGVKRYFFTESYSFPNVIYSHTRKELEEAGFGWMFDCEGIEIEEVTE